MTPNYSFNRTLTRYAGSRRLTQALGIANDMASIFAKVHRAFMLATVCGAAGALVNFVVLVVPFLLLDGPRSQEWLRSYGSAQGAYFVGVTIVFGALVFPFARKLRTS